MMERDKETGREKNYRDDGDKRDTYRLREKRERQTETRVGERGIIRNESNRKQIGSRDTQRETRTAIEEQT